jgi:hypothetical protein
MNDELLRASLSFILRRSDFIVSSPCVYGYSSDFVIHSLNCNYYRAPFSA